MVLCLFHLLHRHIAVIHAERFENPFGNELFPRRSLCLRDEFAGGREHNVLVLKFFAKLRSRLCLGGDLYQFCTVQFACDHCEVGAVEARRM